MIYWIGYVFFKFLSFLYYPIEKVGVKQIPSKGSFILASNHLSYMDPMIIGLCFWRRISYLAKASLFENKIFGFFLHHVGAFPIKRDSADLSAIKETMKRLKRGCPVVIFPEGTRMAAGGSKEVQPGIGLVAVKSGVPVVPVYIRGSDKVLPPTAKFLRFNPVRVIFGEPKIYSKEDSYLEIATQITGQIYSLASKAK